MDKIKSLDFQLNNAKDINNALNKDGCVIVTNALTDDDLKALKNEIDPHFEETPSCQGDFYGYHTKRISSLIAKSEKCRSMTMNETILEVMDEFLLPSCENYQLNLTQGIRIGPGEYQQPLHRDDVMFHYDKAGSEAMLNCMWAVDDFTAKNGATLLVPESHKWPQDRMPQEEEVVQGVMPAGSVLIWLGSLLHGGGTNNSQGFRTGIVISYCLGWLRQAENQYLAVPRESAQNYPEKLQKLLGYFVHSPNLGCVNGSDPINLLKDSPPENEGFTEFLPDDVKPLIAEHRKQKAA